MKTRLFALSATFSLAACASTPPAPALDSASLVGTSWTQGVGSNAPRLNFATAISVNGTGGCNNFSGKAELTGSKVTLGPLAATKKMCLGPPQHVEDVFFRALADARSLQLDGGQLVLLNQSGQEVARLDKVAR